MEYKFRGKANNEWYYGDLIIDEGRYYICLQVNDHIKRDDYEVYMIEVIPETVGQYTGLHDKNGKEICEKDIIKGNYYYETGNVLDSTPRRVEFIGKIGFEEGTFQIECIKGHVHNSPKRAMFALLYFNVKIEIIGNTTDNPELLKCENKQEIEYKECIRGE